MQLKPDDERPAKRAIRAWLRERKLPDPGPDVPVEKMLAALYERDPNEKAQSP